MHHLNRSGSLRRTALTACLLGALPLSLTAQIRRPAPVPSGRTATKPGVPKRRAEFFAGVGTQGLSSANATKSSMLMGTAGYRRQYSSYEWLHVGGMVDIGGTSIDGEYFPFERRAVGDTTQFFSVGGKATMFAARLTADAIVPLGESKRIRYGGGVNLGMYAMMPTPAAGADAGTFVAPTFGFTVLGAADVTPRLGATASVSLNQFMGFDRDKLRPSDPALADPVFTTPFTPVPDAKKSFSGARLMVGLTYRLGVKNVAGGKK